MAIHNGERLSGGIYFAINNDSSSDSDYIKIRIFTPTGYSVKHGVSLNIIRDRKSVDGGGEANSAHIISADYVLCSLDSCFAEGDISLSNFKEIVESESLIVSIFNIDGKGGQRFIVPRDNLNKLYYETGLGRESPTSTFLLSHFVFNDHPSTQAAALYGDVVAHIKLDSDVGIDSDCYTYTKPFRLSIKTDFNNDLAVFSGRVGEAYSAELTNPAYATLGFQRGTYSIFNAVSSELNSATSNIIETLSSQDSTSFTVQSDGADFINVVKKCNPGSVYLNYSDPSGYTKLNIDEFWKPTGYVLAQDGSKVGFVLGRSGPDGVNYPDRDVVGMQFEPIFGQLMKTRVEAVSNRVQVKY